jgi:hypothetical protein
LTGFLYPTHRHPSSYCYHHHCILHPFHIHRKHTNSHINSPTMDPSQYGFYQQSGNQIMGNQPLSATSGGHVSQHFHSGGIYYGYPPAAPYQGQYHDPQGSYVVRYRQPLPSHIRLATPLGCKSRKCRVMWYRQPLPSHTCRLATPLGCKHRNNPRCRLLLRTLAAPAGSRAASKERTSRVPSAVQRAPPASWEILRSGWRRCHP